MDQNPDHMFSHSPSPFHARNACHVPLLCCLLFLMDVEAGNFDDFYNHITLLAVLVGPLTLMTCGLLVLSTLLNEVSMCTNSRSKDLSAHYGYLGYWNWVYYVILQIENGAESESIGKWESHERLDIYYLHGDSVFARLLARGKRHGMAQT